MLYIYPARNVPRWTDPPPTFWKTCVVKVLSPFCTLRRVWRFCLRCQVEVLAIASCACWSVPFPFYSTSCAISCSQVPLIPQFTSWVPSTFMLLVSLFGRSFFVVLLLFFQSRAHPGRWQGSSQRGLKITEFPHLFIHFLQFHFSLPLHLSPTPSTFAHPFHRLLPLFPILLLHTHSLPSANRTQSFIPAHSVLGFSPSLRHDPVGHSGPLGLLRVFFLSLLPLCNLGSVGHSGPLFPLLPLNLLSLLFSMLLHHCLDSVGHFRPTRSLATSSPFLASALPLFLFLVSPKPEPSRSFRPTRFLAASLLVFPLTLLPLSPLSYFFSTARTQGVIPAHSGFSNLLSLPCFRPPPSFT